MVEESSHVPVLRDEALAALAIRADGVYLDGTFGRGGHARAMLQQLGPSGRLLLMDKDPDAIRVAHEAFAGDPRVRIRHASFAQLGEWDETRDGLDGVLLDLGVSSPQLDRAERGFSFMNDGPLDMRMDPTSGVSAAQWLARASEREIVDALFEFGEERDSRRIARAVVAARAQAPIATTRELAELVARAVRSREPGKNPATRTFQALRIVVNGELLDLAAGLQAATARLIAQGRLVVISFHSLEDRVVKRFIRAGSRTAGAVRRGLPPPPDAAPPTLIAVGDAQMPGAAETAATAIRIGNPASWDRAVRTIRETNGVVVSVSDAAIFEAKAVVDASGVGCEPASAASVAGVQLLRARGVIAAGDRVVCILTGHLLKDPESVATYHGSGAARANLPVEVDADLRDIERVLKGLLR